MLDQLVRGIAAAIFVKSKESFDHYQRQKDAIARAPIEMENAQSNARIRQRMREQFRDMNIKAILSENPSAAGFSRDILERLADQKILEQAGSLIKEYTAQSHKLRERMCRAVDDEKAFEKMREFWSNNPDAYAAYGREKLRFLNMKNGVLGDIEKLSLLKIASEWQLSDFEVRVVGEIVKLVYDSHERTDPIGLTGRANDGVPDGKRLFKEMDEVSLKACVLDEWNKAGEVFVSKSEHEEKKLEHRARELSSGIDFSRLR